MTDGTGSSQTRQVNARTGDAHSRVAGPLRVCSNPSCGHYTPRESCPECGWTTDKYPPPRPR